MKVQVIRSSELGNDWTAEAHVGHAEHVSSSASSSEESMPVIPRPPATEKCWKEGCEELRAVDYWCEAHGTARRERIKAEMAKLANDSHGIPRNHGGTGVPFVAHDITIQTGYDYRLNRDEWWWVCTCGKGGDGTKTEGIARAASRRHLRAIEKSLA